MMGKICLVLVIVCIVLNGMNITAFSIHRHKLNEIDECFHKIECKEIEVLSGEKKEICYNAGCDYIKLWDEYDDWKSKGVSSSVWRLFG